MKPFDLQKALAGEKVVTRDGREVTQLVKFDVIEGNSLLGVVGGNIVSWDGNGRYWVGASSSHDLFMAPKETTYWVNVYRDANGQPRLLSPVLDTEKAAESMEAINLIKTISFTVEE